LNTLRLLSRQLFTQINNGDANAAKQIDEVLQELRKKLFNYNESFCSRFLNEEIRSLAFYEEGSALRHLATIKELFATHIALLWLSNKVLNGNLQDKNLSGSEKEKLVFLRNTIKELLSSEHLLGEISHIVNSSEKVMSRKSNFTTGGLSDAFNTFEQDKTPA
jgi:hypothetical protein